MVILPPLLAIKGSIMEVLVIDYQAPDAPTRFVESMRGTGFGVLTNHTINHTLIDQVYRDWQVFFNLPEAEKRQFLFNRNYELVQDGFFPLEVAEVAKGNTIRDIKEFFHYYPSISKLPVCISAATRELREELLDMAKVLLGWLEQALPVNLKHKLSMPLRKMVDEQYQTLLRILHYPPLPDSVEEGAIRAAPHEDINLITLLVAASAPGLQVLDAKGKWHDVPCEKNNIVVNVGDMLQEATGEYYKATTHQVVNPIGEAAKTSRFSIPLFLHARDEVVLSERYTARTYRDERLRELGLLEEKA